MLVSGVAVTGEADVLVDVDATVDEAVLSLAVTTPA